MRWVTMVRLFGSLGPVDHQPKLLQLALWYLKTARKDHLLPGYTGVLSCSRSGFPPTMLPCLCRSGSRNVMKVACVRGGLLVHDAVFAFEGRGHLLDPASVFLGGDLQEKLQIEFAQVRAEGKAVAIGRVAQHRSRDDLIGKRLFDQS